MGQAEIKEFLHKNPNKFFFPYEIKQVIGSNIQSIYSALKKLEKSNEVKVEEVRFKQGPVKKRFAFVLKDDGFEKVFHEYQQLKEQTRFRNYPSEWLIGMMQIVEMRKRNEGGKI